LAREGAVACGFDAEVTTSMHDAHWRVPFTLLRRRSRGETQRRSRFLCHFADGSVSQR